MASLPGDTRTAGGKISKIRRPPPSSRTPYARPSTSSIIDEQDEIQNPNWLSNLIYPAKVIVSGAGKIFSFFGNDDDSSSQDDDDNGSSENDDDEADEVENHESDKVFSLTSKSVNKRKIEQLVLEETFSREEGNQLIRLVKSRMVGRNGTLGEGTPPTRNKAIMEARKWLQEKRSGSKKKLEAELDSLSQFTRSEKGSPADMAKSYMQNRPTWASPSLKHVEFGSPSTLGMQHFKEETPTSTLRSSELKKSSFTSGSWNLLDEIRRVRTKATEEFPTATPLTKTGLSLSTPAKDILESKGIVEAPGPLKSTHIEADDVLPDAVTNSFLRDSQDGNSVQFVENQDCPEPFVEVSVLRYNNDDEVKESRTTSVENGVAPPGYVHGEHGAEKPSPSEEENENPAGSSQVRSDVHVENSNTILTDPIDIPCTTTTDTALNGSQNSSSFQEEDLSLDFSQPTVAVATELAKGTQKEKKPRGYTRRGQGRGK